MAPLLDAFLWKLGPWGWARRGVDWVPGWAPWRKTRLYRRWAPSTARYGDDLGDPPPTTNPLHWITQSFASRPLCGSPTGDRTIEFEYLSQSPRGCRRCIELGVPLLMQRMANTR